MEPFKIVLVIFAIAIISDLVPAYDLSQSSRQIHRHRRAWAYPDELFFDPRTTGSSGLGRSLRGKNATPCTILYHVAILVLTASEDEPILCGGSILSEDYILTSAYCTDPKTLGARPNATINFIVVAGYTAPGLDTTQVRYGTAVLVGRHPNWSADRLEYDFAVLSLRHEPLKLNHCVNAIPLACRMHEPQSDDCLETSGYGSADPADADGSLLALKYAKLRAVDWNRCVEMHQANERLLDEGTMICADEGERAEPCNSDSGAPLVFRRWLIGLVSWGVGGCGDYPEVYARVSAACSFINCVTAGKVKCDCKEAAEKNCSDACKDSRMNPESYCAIVDNQNKMVH